MASFLSSSIKFNDIPSIHRPEEVTKKSENNACSIALRYYYTYIITNFLLLRFFVRLFVRSRTPLFALLSNMGAGLAPIFCTLEFAHTKRLTCESIDACSRSLRLSLTCLSYHLPFYSYIYISIFLSIYISAYPLSINISIYIFKRIQ